MTTADLLKKYYEVRLTRYLQKMPEREAGIAASFALQDMMTTVKRQSEIYTTEEICSLIQMDIEDIETSIK